uniref:Uncharacterized protein n=1 Tax=Magallana gigas TaxID=29159 RepID=K1R653_MAGGI
MDVDMIPTVFLGANQNQRTVTSLDVFVPKISVIESIAENLHVEDSRAELCPGTTKHQTSEAFVMNKCNSKSRSSWTQGQTSLKTVCSTQLTIPSYTPISTFYKSEENVAGFFIACTDAADGIKVAVQNCSDPPKVLTITETTSPKMSDFFIIYERNLNIHNLLICISGTKILSRITGYGALC